MCKTKFIEGSYEQVAAEATFLSIKVLKPRKGEREIIACDAVLQCSKDIPRFAHDHSEAESGRCSVNTKQKMSLKGIQLHIHTARCPSLYSFPIPNRVPLRSAECGCHV
jgi:hypothetical protein